MKRFWLPFAYLALGTALTLVACGDDDDDPTTPLKGAGGKAGASGKAGTGGGGMGASGAGGSGTAGGGTGGSGTDGSGTGGSGTGGGSSAGAGGAGGEAGGAGGQGGTGGSGTGGSGTGGTGTAGSGGSGTGGSGTGGSGTGGTGTAGTGGSGTGGTGTGGSGTGGTGTGGSGTGGTGGGGGKIVINEVVFDPPGTDAGCYLELKGSPGASLNGLAVRGINGNGGTVYAEIKFDSSHSLDANGYFVVRQDDTVVLPGGAASITDPLANLQNGPDSIALVDGSGNVLDAVGYTDQTGKFDPPNVFAGEGKFVVAPPSGGGAPNTLSLSRLPNGSDTNDNATDFAVGTRTPGATNVAAPTVGFCNIQFPATICSTPNNPTANIYTQIYVPGVTDASGTPAAGIKAEIGFGPSGSDPRSSGGWTFVAATVNTGFDFNNNNDEYQATLPAQANPTAPNAPFAYVYRVTYNNGIPLFCDTTGTNTEPPTSSTYLPFSVADLGTWTVAATCP